MPRWPVIAVGVFAYINEPWVIATLVLLGVIFVWYGPSRTYRHAIPLLAIFGALAWYAFGGQAHAKGLPRCTGLCYGSISGKSHLPRNNYVKPHVRRNGQYAQPYTRSK